jgi:hypothetical protein
MRKPNICIASRGEKRIQDAVCIVRHREQLASLFALQFNTKFSEELDGWFHSKSTQHMTDCWRRTSCVIGIINTPVRDIATAAASNQDLGT